MSIWEKYNEAQRRAAQPQPRTPEITSPIPSVDPKKQAEQERIAKRREQSLEFFEETGTLGILREVASGIPGAKVEIVDSVEAGHGSTGNLTARVSWQGKQIQHHLSEGKTVVVDETFGISVEYGGRYLHVEAESVSIDFHGITAKNREELANGIVSKLQEELNTNKEINVVRGELSADYHSGPIRPSGQGGIQ